PRFVGAILHSEHARRSFERIGVPPERLLVAHNGYDPERMEPRLSTVEARAALGLPEQPTVAYSGRVQMSKGLDIVLEMATRCPEIHFLLVGSEGEGEVERHARRLPNVTVVPWQKFDRTVRYLYAADVLLLPPSLGPLAVGNTVLPMKLFLYLAAGRALLAPKAPDTEELLVHGSNSRLVEPGDAEVASDALRALVEDHETRQRLAEGAFETGKGLTWDARASRIEAFLAERLAQGGETPAKDPWSTVTWLKESARWLVEKR
ncbi:MAG: glycosyltransferase, partial [Myxococcales bacterium]|nr:glycosyltransferase [Myxococcales bacterium]